MQIQNILVIDDDEVCDMLLSCLIEDVFKACSIIVKKNGGEALNYLRLLPFNSAQFPDLIILDFNLPDMKACEFIKAFETNFTATFPHTQIVVLTCHAREGDRQAILQFSSVVAFFNKPLEEKQLLQIKEVREGRSPFASQR